MGLYTDQERNERMTTQEAIEKMLKKSEQIINTGQFEETPTNNYIFRVDADGFHFSRRAFTYDELANIRNYALGLRRKRLDG